jgi:hypothetical protein
MTLPRFSRVSPWRPFWPAVIGCCLMSVLAACSGAAAQVQLPPRPAKAKADAIAAPAPVAPQQQVVAALTGYTNALGQADKSKDPALARQLLRPYLAPGRISGLVSAVRSIWARGENFYGQDELHVLSVRIDGKHAFVHDCDNTSGMGLETPAGQPVPGSAGVPEDNLVTRLDLVGGHWLVEFQLIEDVPCAP